MLRKSIDFVKKDIWKISHKDQSPRMSFLIRQLKILLLAFKGFNEDKVQVRASALTYYSVLSVVPVMAMVIGIAKGFGFQESVEKEIEKAFSGQQEVQNFLLDFTSKYIESIQGGVIAGIGLGLLVWTVMKVFGNIESSFNDIWQIKKGRSFSRKFSDYLSMMLIAPVLVVLSSGANVFIQGIAGKYELFLGLDYIVKLLIATIPYVLIWLLFTLIYMVMPNTKVNFRYAIIAGIIAGTMFQILQWGYITFQGAFSRYNTVYGTFAALPLFLIWLQTSWIIVLFGAEVSFAYQNIENYEFESDSVNISIRAKKLLTLLVSHLVIKRFSKGDFPLTSSEISHQLEIPIRLIRDIIHDLVNSEIFSEVATENPKETKYQPALDIHKLTVSFVLNKVDEKGSNNFHAVRTETLQKLEQIQNDFYKSIHELPTNMLIKDI